MRITCILCRALSIKCCMSRARTNSIVGSKKEQLIQLIIRNLIPEILLRNSMFCTLMGWGMRLPKTSFPIFVKERAVVVCLPCLLSYSILDSVRPFSSSADRIFQQFSSPANSLSIYPGTFQSLKVRILCHEKSISHSATSFERLTYSPGFRLRFNFSLLEFNVRSRSLYCSFSLPACSQVLSGAVVLL